jgi:hypothetical protein
MSCDQQATNQRAPAELKVISLLGGKTVLPDGKGLITGDKFNGVAGIVLRTYCQKQQTW